MKTVLMLALLAASFSIAALATPTACPVATLNNYLTPGFSCLDGHLLASDWTFASAANPSSLAVPASGIQVDPEIAPLNDGFQFSMAMAVFGVQVSEDVLIGFTATCPDDANCIHDLYLFFDGQRTGTGLSGVTENYCLNHSLIGCPTGQSGQIAVTNPPPAFNDLTFFAPAHSISLSKDIQVNSGREGQASISQVINSISEVSGVPEPGTLVLVGAGLLFVGRLYRWHTKDFPEKNLLSWLLE